MNDLLLQARAVLIGITVVAFSLLFGYWIANGSWYQVVAALVSAALLVALIAPGYTALLALGILMPVSLPIPGFNYFPFMAPALFFLAVKYVLRRALKHRGELPLRLAMPWSIAVFFGIVAASYLVDPVLPGAFSSSRTEVTGFRPYAAYGLSLLTMLSVAWFIRDRDEMVGLVRWMTIFSTALSLFFIPLTFTKSPAAAQVLGGFSVFVTAFDNGWLRFVILGQYGLMLIAAALLPHLVPLRPSLRAAMFGLGCMAVVLSGSRGFVVMTAVMILVIALLRRQRLLLHAAVWGTTLFLSVSWYLGENLSFTRGVGIYRFVTLVSGRAAEYGEASQTMTWRKVRWDRALHDIGRRPWAGWGYRGLSGAFVYSNYQQYEAAQVDIDVANGTIHNGFLAASRALGIPAAVLVTLVLIWRTWNHFRKAWQMMAKDDSLIFSLHVLVAANLAIIFPWAYIGADFNQPWIWFVVGMGLVVDRLAEPVRTELLDSASDMAGPVRPMIRLVQR